MQKCVISGEETIGQSAIKEYLISRGLLYRKQSSISVLGRAGGRRRAKKRDWTNNVKPDKLVHSTKSRLQISSSETTTAHLSELRLTKRPLVEYFNFVNWVFLYGTF